MKYLLENATFLHIRCYKHIFNCIRGCVLHCPVLLISLATWQKENSYLMKVYVWLCIVTFHAWILIQHTQNTVVLILQKALRQNYTCRHFFVCLVLNEHLAIQLLVSRCLAIGQRKALAPPTTSHLSITLLGTLKTHAENYGSEGTSQWSRYLEAREIKDWCILACFFRTPQEVKDPRRPFLGVK